MENVIRFVVGNFTLTLLVLGLVASVVSLLRTSRPWTPSMLIEAIFSYFILFSIALSYLYNFVLHVFFGEMTARFIGWADSPFQREVGFANLGFAVVGFLHFGGASTCALPRLWELGASCSARQAFTFWRFYELAT
jgi:Family of unknown function (DUF6790)